MKYFWFGLFLICFSTFTLGTLDLRSDFDLKIFSEKQYFVGNDLGDFIENPESLWGKESWFMWTIPTLVMFVYDRPLTQYYVDNLAPEWQSIAHRNWPLNFNRDDLLFEVNKYLFIYENLNPNPGLKRYVFCTSEALIDAFFVSQSLKHVFGRQRPSGLARGGNPGRDYTHITADPHNWFNFNFTPDGEFTSMPSTHGTVYFAHSTILGKAIDNELLGDVFGFLNYYIMPGNHMHWASDMWIGYVLGKAIGKYVWDRYEGEDLSDKWFVYPSFYPGEGRYYPVIAFWKMF
ncbi:hypothetical protein HOC37_06095 [bacterium]|jgi:hypothetical protein|nr:hypothetical protein [bacterium]MBT3581427.1 hypothetical protein [bacterium]MBT4552533.1 hypothetical protein [bacterium]MBT5988676.1 hypothetical protein [bacterium]MBT7088128.1 hypothetical protein [bacterium]